MHPQQAGLGPDTVGGQEGDAGVALGESQRRGTVFDQVGRGEAGGETVGKAETVGDRASNGGVADLRLRFGVGPRGLQQGAAGAGARQGLGRGERILGIGQQHGVAQRVEPQIDAVFVALGNVEVPVEELRFAESEVAPHRGDPPATLGGGGFEFDQDPPALLERSEFFLQRLALFDRLVLFGEGGVEAFDGGGEGFFELAAPALQVVDRPAGRGLGVFGGLQRLGQSLQFSGGVLAAIGRFLRLDLFLVQAGLQRGQPGARVEQFGTQSVEPRLGGLGLAAGVLDPVAVFVDRALGLVAFRRQLAAARLEGFEGLFLGFEFGAVLLGEHVSPRSRRVARSVRVRRAPLRNSWRPSTRAARSVRRP